MTIKNHRLVEAEYVPSPNKSGVIDPKFIVMHYTAGYTGASAINTLTRKSSKVSAHVVVDLDGTITQLVPFDTKAWHAGPSSYNGWNGLNNYSIGIEIVNMGFLKKVGRNTYEDAYGNIKKWKSNELVEARHSRVGSGTYYWPRYTKQQLEAVLKLTEELVSMYDIVDIVTHEEIDNRGWKTDPGPAFPMKIFKNLVNDRENDADRYQVTASTLNVRSGPGSNFKATAKIKKGTVVSVQMIKGDWVRISDDDWVHSGYLRRM